MTSVEQIIKTITEKNYHFQISIPGQSFKSGRITIAQALIDSPSLEDYFSRIFKLNNAKNILVKMITPNGSSYKLREEHIVFLPSPETVATTQQTATTIATTVAPNLKGTDEELKPQPKTMSIDDQIALGVLKIEHKLNLQRKEELERENKELVKKVDALQAEKLDLVRENGIQKDRNDLDIQRTKLEIDKDNKAGLSGIIGEIKENPEVLKMIIGLVRPDHPMFKSDIEHVAGLPEAKKYHDNDAINSILEDLPNTIKTLDGTKIAKVYTIFQEFMNTPDLIETVFKDHVEPELIKRQTQTPAA